MPGRGSVPVRAAVRSILPGHRTAGAHMLLMIDQLQVGLMASHHGPQTRANAGLAIGALDVSQRRAPARQEAGIDAGIDPGLLLPWRPHSYRCGRRPSAAALQDRAMSRA